MEKPDSRYQRRKFLKSTAMLGGISLLPGSASAWLSTAYAEKSSSPELEKSIIGAYGSWAAGLAGKQPLLSFRSEKWQNLDSWKKEALTKTTECISAPEVTKKPKISIDKKYTYDGLEVEEISWQLSYGARTEAILLKPHGATK